MKCFFLCLTAQDSNNKNRKKGLKRPAPETPAISTPPPNDDFAINSSQTGKNLCICCFKYIATDQIGIKKIIHGIGPTDITVWYHLKCFSKHSTVLGWYGELDDMPGFNLLNPKDQVIMKKKTE